VNRQQIHHENLITGYTFSKPVTGWKPVNRLRKPVKRLTGFQLNKPKINNDVCYSVLTGTFFGMEYTSLTALVSEGGGGSGSSGCEYGWKKNNKPVKIQISLSVITQLS